MTKKHLLFPLAVLIIMILVISSIVLIYYQVIPRNQVPPWHWRGLIPGQTTSEQVIEILGQPDQIIHCDKWGKEAETTYSDGFPSTWH